MFVPFDHQEKAIEAGFNDLETWTGGNSLIIAPTGSGKSVIIACLCQKILQNWKAKILIISHTEEILKQDIKALKKQLPGVDIGVYSASLKKKTVANVTVAGIQSIYKRPQLFIGFDLIIVDEAHMIPLDAGSRYRSFFSQVGSQPVVGLTATPFRLGSGYLTEGEDAFFHRIIYNIHIKTLQKAGKLCEIVLKGTKNKLDATNLKKQAGDFITKELSLAFDRKEITKKIVKELYNFKNFRKSWLVFAIDIKHAEHLNQELNNIGIVSAVVHSQIKGKLKNNLIGEFKGGKYQALVSVSMITTGFDVPWIDLIAGCRPTTSPILHVQIPGRGMRVYPGKKNCLYLDFAGNLVRNGPLDAPLIKTIGSGGGGGAAMMKECPKCREIVPIAVRVCPKCEEEFKFQHHLTSKPFDAKVLSVENWHRVNDVKYTIKTSLKTGLDYLNITYECGLRVFSEGLYFENQGYARFKAREKWRRQDTKDKIPNSSKEAFLLSKNLKKPFEILVNENEKYPKIKDILL